MTTNVGLPCYELSIMTEKDAVYWNKLILQGTNTFITHASKISLQLEGEWASQGCNFQESVQDIGEISPENRGTRFSSLLKTKLCVKYT